MVPDGAAAVVVLPTVPVNPLTELAPSLSEVEIRPGEAYSAAAVTVAGDTLDNSGSLTVVHEATIEADFYSDGTASLGALENDGVMSIGGAMTVSASAVNRGVIQGTAALTAARFENMGTLFDATGTLTIAGAGFDNLSGGTLTGGTYELGAGQAIDLDFNGPITTLAANLQCLGSATLQTYGTAGTSYVTVQSSLTTIAPSGLLVTEVAYANANALTVQGQLVIDGGSFSAPSLTITGGAISASAFGGIATITASGGIIDDGSILAMINPETEGESVYENSTVLIASVISGTGMLAVGAGQGTAAVTLELAAADSASVVFADASGILQLDAPRAFTGTIKSFASGDSIVLSGVGAVTASSYSGDATHGTLSLVTAGGTVSLVFLGDYTTASFTVGAGSAANSILITDGAGSVSPNWTATTAISAYQLGVLPGGAVIADSAAAVANQIDLLQGAAAAGDLSAIVLTDLDSATSPVVPPVLTVSASQYLADARVLGLIDSGYSIDITAATALQAESMAGGSHVAAITVSDSADNLVLQIDRLGVLAATGQISSIEITGSGNSVLSLTATQLDADHAAFDEMSGNFSVAVTASAANVSVETVAGHGVTVIFSGTASDYSLSPQGDGIGLTVNDTGTGRTSLDSLRGITAIQFSDFTDIVAQTPVSGGTVTTGNVAELYGAVFGRVPDVPGLAFYQAALAASPSTSLTTFAQYFLASAEYTGNSAHNYEQGTAGDSQFITDSYQNLLHRAPESGAIPYYLAVIDGFTNGLAPGTAAYATAQNLGHAYVLTYFSQSPEFLTDVQVTAATPSSAQHWLVLI